MVRLPVSQDPEVTGGRRADAVAVGRLVQAVQSRLAGGLRRALKPVAVTPQLAAALEAIDAHPGIGQQELAEELGGAFHSRVVVWLDELERRGWILRTTDRTDRRRRRVWPTADGHRTARDLRHSTARPAVEATADLDDAELSTLRRLLARVAGRRSTGDPAD